jgi:hypothetical protein
MTAATTPIDRAEINRRNAQKSTGPRTPEGKSHSRFNALKHGMAAKTVVLPGEDAGVLQMRVESWITELQPRNDLEEFLVEQAVHLSWKMERADRAEVAQLSRIIESAPIDEARRQQEVADALGYWLLSDRGVWAEPRLQDNVRNVLGSQSGSAKGSGHLDILDHPQAIVFRLESTEAGCRWLLDRWTELRARLETGKPWSRDQKVKALRLLGKRPPGEDDPLDWEDDLEVGDDSDDPESEAYFDKQLDQQLDERLAAKEPARIVVLRSLADQAIGRLEALATEHRQRSEAEAAQQATRLSFDAGAEGERLRRYQFSCSRSLFRALDTLLKIRRQAAKPQPASPKPASSPPSESLVDTFAGLLVAQDDDPPPVDAPEILLEAKRGAFEDGIPTFTADTKTENLVPATDGFLTSTAATHTETCGHAMNGFLTFTAVTAELAETPTERRADANGESDPSATSPAIMESTSPTTNANEPSSRSHEHPDLQNEPNPPTSDDRDSQNEANLLPSDHQNRRNEPRPRRTHRRPVQNEPTTARRRKSFSPPSGGVRRPQPACA